jgi:predicted dehydrogenase/threonine dehydrogenase-like Zn-dependent dehydrogenase
MKQIFKVNKVIATFEAPLPTPGDNELLIAVCCSVISTGTETMGMKRGNSTLSEKLKEKKTIWDKIVKIAKERGITGTIKSIRKKITSVEKAILYEPVGYSNSGFVISKGRLVREFNVGDRVACAGSGIAAHSEYSAVPVNLSVKLPDEVSFEAAGFTTIGAIAMQGIRRANVTFGETIVITGLGLLGLIAVQIAKAWGLVVIGSDINQKRLDLAKELGADICINANDPAFLEKVNNATQGNGADSVIIYAATKSSEPANQALKVCRRKGRVVIVGAVGMDIERDAMYMNELDFVISTSYGPGRYDDLYELKGIDYPIGYVRWTENRNMLEFVRLLSSGLVKVDKLISNKFSIDEVIDAYESLVNHPGDNISSIFTYFHDDEEVPDNKLIINTRNFDKEKIAVGIIGAGNFIQNNHLKNMMNLPEEFEIVGIAEKTPASARSISDKYKINYVTTDFKQLLSDPEIDLIVIGTRHNLHANQVTEAIKNKKNVLVEKPLAMSHEELTMIETAFKEAPYLLAAVGFNRRYSPITQMAKSEIVKNNKPVVINYRVNAGHFSPDIWIQDLEEGGGRIIGEVCHFIDLIVYLASSRVKEINTIHIGTDGRIIESEDNIIVSLAFDNGSIGVLTYTSIGGMEMEKERIEIFTNNSSMIINDFIEFKTFNCNAKGIKLKQVDKGHKALISELSKKLKNRTSLILPFETDIEMTRLTLSIVDHIHQI